MPDLPSSILRSPSDARALLELGLSTGTDEVDLLETVAGRLPGLEVQEVLGAGGMGVVYLARQRSLDRLVAVKVLNPELARRPEFAVRFEQEAKILAALRHPGIVEVYDVGEADGFYYIVMEYVAGASLRAEMGEPMAPERVRSILRGLCAVLQDAHERGVIHRDVKPENILIDEQGRLKVADFGLAKLMSGPNLSLTATLTAAGTLLYMAPEQLEGRGAIGPATDLYSVGVLAYELLTTRLPVGRFGPPSAEGAASDELDDVVMRCLERDPQKRFESAEALAAALNAAPGRLAVPAVVAEPSSSIRKRACSSSTRRGRTWMFAGLGVAVSLGFLFAAGAHHDNSIPVQQAASEPAERECMTAHGKTACGYNCVVVKEEVACAERPDMQCIVGDERRDQPRHRRHREIACGYDCIKSHGQVACAPEPEMSCAAAGGEVKCGPGCRAERGGIVCDAPEGAEDEETMPRPTRFSGSINGVFEREPIVVVPSGRGAEKLAEYARRIGTEFSVELREAADFGAEDGQRSWILYGTPDTSQPLRRWLAAMEWEIGPSGIKVGDRQWMGDDLVLIAAHPDPKNQARAVLVYAAHKPSDVVQVNTVFHGPTDWLVARREDDGFEVVDKGNFPRDAKGGFLPLDGDAPEGAGGADKIGVPE